MTPTVTQGVQTQTNKKTQLRKGSIPKKRKCNLKKETILFLLFCLVFFFVCILALWTIMSTHWHQSVMHAYPKLKNLEKPEK